MSSTSHKPSSPHAAFPRAFPSPMSASRLSAYQASETQCRLAAVEGGSHYEWQPAFSSQIDMATAPVCFAPFPCCLIGRRMVPV
jgi:hypothetical protein